MRSRQIVAGTFARAFSVEARSSGRPEWLSCESVATKDETEAAREDAAVGGSGGGGFRLARVKRKTTTKKTVEACSRAGMRTKLKLGRVCRLVASWQAQARRGETLRGAAKTVTRREARRVGQGKAKAELESGSLSLPFCSFFACRRLRSPKSPPWLLAAFPLPPFFPSHSLSFFPRFLVLFLFITSFLSDASASSSSTTSSLPSLSSPDTFRFFFFLLLVLFSSFPRFLPFFFSPTLPPRFAEEL